MATRVTLFTVNGPGLGITFPETKQECIDSMEAFFADPEPCFSWEDVSKNLNFTVQKSQIFYVEFKTIT